MTTPSTESACASCDKAGRHAGRYDWEACIEGQVYGPCSSDNCYGVCEWEGKCPCSCHAPIDGSGVIE